MSRLNSDQYFPFPYSVVVPTYFISAKDDSNLQVIKSKNVML